MLDDVKEVCREPIAEMERNGLTAADGWRVTHVRVVGGFVEFTKGDVCITCDGERLGFVWYVMDRSARVGGYSALLSRAIAEAKANGWPL